MQEMEWMSLDDIEYDYIEDITVVKNPGIGTPVKLEICVLHNYWMALKRSFRHIQTLIDSNNRD